MTERDEAIRARCEAATPGPWTYPGGAIVRAPENPGTRAIHSDAICDTFMPNRRNAEASANVAFIAHAREDIPYLLDRVATLESALAEAQRRAECAEADMWTMRSCQSCMHRPDGYPSLHGACKNCDDEDKWVWRGPDGREEQQ